MGFMSTWNQEISSARTFLFVFYHHYSSVVFFLEISKLASIAVFYLAIFDRVSRFAAPFPAIFFFLIDLDLATWSDELLDDHRRSFYSSENRVSGEPALLESDSHASSASFYLHQSRALFFSTDLLELALTCSPSVIAFFSDLKYALRQFLKETSSRFTSA